MKKLILLFILMPFISFAKFYKCNLTLIDGTSINGFIDFPIYADDNKIKFRREEKGKNEKYESSQVKSFEIINDKNETVRFVAIKLAKPKLFNMKEIKVESENSWVRIVREGKISLYSGYYTYNNGRGSSYRSVYYIKRENDDYALYLQEYGGGGLNFNMNGFHSLKKLIKSYFEEVCPKFSEALNKDEINKNGMEYLVNVYEQNCGK